VARDARVSAYPEVQAYLETGDFAGLALDQARQYLGRGAENLAEVVEAVPAKYDYQYGLTYLYPLHTLLPGKQETLDQQLKKALGRTFPGGGFVPSTLGEAYVNFGPAGFLLVPFALGWLMGLLYRRFSQGTGNGEGLLYLFLLYYLSAHMVSGILASSIFPLEAVCLILASNWRLRVPPARAGTGP
jgi:oligosaccharide repeat unit polymerase